MPEYHATDKQILTFWMMLADRKWDDPTELIDGREPRPDYLMHVNHAYRALKAKGYVVRAEMSRIIDDLSCFNGWSVERRMRMART